MHPYASRRAAKIHMWLKIASHLPGFPKDAAILDLLFFVLPTTDDAFKLVSILDCGRSDRK